MLTVQSTRTAKPQPVLFPRYTRRPLIGVVGQTLTEGTGDCGNQKYGAKSDQQVALADRRLTDP